MKRKEFIQKTLKAAAIPLFMNGFHIQSYAHTPALEAISRASKKNGRVLVIIQLNGGNDGLNTIIPLSEYSNLTAARSNVIINESKVLKLNNVTGTGMHPSMVGLKNLYDNGKMSIVQSVGYPNPDFSHFRSMDIWHSASDSNVHEGSGWLGRYLQDLYTGFPDNYPNANDPDPLAISIGYSVSTTLMSKTTNTGVAISNPKEFYQLTTGTVDPAPNTPAGYELTYVRLVMQQTKAYNEEVKTAANSVTNIATYPANNGLADQLKIVANLIAGGLQTPVYTVSIGGFDTHAKQVDATGGTEFGDHANLLKMLTEAISAFQLDLEQLGVADRVAGMTYSEFGRRIRSNASTGTDHGAAAPLIVFGTKVNPGIIGQNPSIPSTVNVEDSVPMQHDFRQIYASVLRDWFEVDAPKTEELIFNQFDTLPIFKQNVSVKDSFKVSNLLLSQNYPNPFNEMTQIDFKVSGGRVQLKLYNHQGKLISTLMDEYKEAGAYSKMIEGNSLPSGNYYYQLITPEGQLTRTMMKM